jgi:hypothetical protein
MFHKPRFVNLVSYVLFAISLGIIITAFAFTMNVDVLKDWHLTLPNGAIHAGDTILVESTYTKVRPVNGTAVRYLECENATNSYIRYPINQAVADRAPGSRTGTGISIVIPESVPDLPAKCRISVLIKYPVYPWRTVSEYNATQSFTLLPKVVAPAVVSSTATQTSPSPIVYLSPSLPQDTSITNSQQPDSSQPSAAPVATETVTQPSLIQRILSPITKLLGGL